MEELVRFMAKSLVDHPDLVDVRTVEEPASTVIELRVGPDDMGKVIAKAIRTVVKAASAKSEKPVYVEIMD